MPTNHKNLLCHYHYDALDRLVNCAPSMQANTQRFYLRNRLTTEIQGQVQRTVFQHDDLLLAQQQRQGNVVNTALLTTDQQRSVLNVLDAVQLYPFTYTPYGHRAPEDGLLSLLGFNGERPDPVTGHYLLGNGYRAFNPVLMRFNSPDSWSPFGEGGLNAYAYSIDPLNFLDLTGHTPQPIKNLFKVLPGVTRTITRTRAVSKMNVGAQKLAVQPGKMENIRPINEDIFSFEDLHRGAKRLNILAHGSPSSSKNGYHRIGSAREALSPDDLYDAGTKAGVNFIDSDKIRLLICFSANGNSNSFAARLAQLTGKPVKGYVGKVLTSPGTTIFKREYLRKSPDLLLNADGSYTYSWGMLVIKKQQIRLSSNRIISDPNFHSVTYSQFNNP
ncbi:RHS repeat-associated core domain-containing protein [Pseudomonas sp. T1.Ur]|uniref:RHS repeat-associated core domain-containing protein n=1 Tax=Pseudomonas sp. T1.Ur TaxID=2928704 RepID=UPI00201D7425|nr:RHS repeat-associated core domain-containing protein [Pseudomonas sp. T1.Ur]MCL6700746.1 RHS repeat-associated core domain-containing protein [Pseudomonas sp. T1.Ur]